MEFVYERTNEQKPSFVKNPPMWALVNSEDCLEFLLVLKVNFSESSWCIRWAPKLQTKNFSERNQRNMRNELKIYHQHINLIKKQI